MVRSNVVVTGGSAKKRRFATNSYGFSPPDEGWPQSHVEPLLEFLQLSLQYVSPELTLQVHPSC
jgi:hypothetical protein